MELGVRGVCVDSFIVNEGGFSEKQFLQKVKGSFILSGIH